jgi:hypothetical protein
VKQGLEDKKALLCFGSWLNNLKFLLVVGQEK